MSDAADDTEREAIREAKRERLRDRATSPDEPVHVESTAHFEELVSDNRLVLVDCYADWCGPCKMLAPTVEAIAAETAAVVAKVDVDEHQDVAQRHGVRGIPALFLYVDGEVVERLVGVQDEATLRDLIAEHEA
ncbi:thioredoxin [Haloarcula litorea]|uniref:thioredoxin n=1 Tax=Haloarcula litorea TaxID=3032579 RepID=UPI0023E7B904|nr:thioredoxin [Halomicroarcula sp. GDY20]